MFDKDIPLSLPARVVVQAARKAFDEGRLAIQHGIKSCAYRSPQGHPCAIGAAIQDEKTAQKFDTAGFRSQSITIASLVARGFVVTDDLEVLDELQGAHDGGDLTNFCKVLERVEKKVGLA